MTKRGIFKSLAVKHFLNHAMLAPNVMTVPVDPAIVAEFEPLADEAGLDRADFSIARPKWNSDVRWVGPNSERTFELFESAFDRLAVADCVAPYVELASRVRLFTAMIVLRSRCEEPDFHIDWVRTNNEAFTLLTPISPPIDGFGLVYKKITGETASYDYRRGEAIVFGDHFNHSTAPGVSERPMALLCFNFGTDRMEHWDKIAHTTAKQTGIVRRPDGEYERCDLTKPRPVSDP